MRIALYILLALIFLVLGFFAWFYFIFLKVPALEIPAEADQVTRIEAIDTWLSDLQKANKFNGTILIAKEGETLLAEGYGFTDASQTERLHPNSSLRLASVSKQFTAAAIMLLHERDSLNYDSPVSDYIAGFPYEGVTVHHLLNQTSGVPDAYMGLAEQNKQEIKILSNAKAVELLLEANPKADAAPNEQYAYSNTNYILLARIVEVVSGKSFEEFMRSELFEPLGMTNTRIWNLLSEDESFPNKTSGFSNFGGEIEAAEPTFIDGVAGDGAVFSSINDFLIWDKFWYKNDLISKENLAEAFKKVTLNDGSVSEYGFGWVITNEHAMWHNGAWLAARTMIARDTKSKTCFVLLDNSTNLAFDKIASQITKNIKNEDQNN